MNCMAKHIHRLHLLHLIMSGFQYIYWSMFFAFAAENPNMEFLFWFVLPIKVKWLAILDAVYLIYCVVENIVSGFSYLSQGGTLAAAGVSLRTDFNVDLLLCGSGNELVATVAGNLCLIIFWMDSFLHELTSSSL